MKLTMDQILAWAELFKSAEAIGATVVDGVRGLARKEMTPEELKDVEVLWQENVDRSAKNAGLE